MPLTNNISSTDQLDSESLAKLIYLLCDVLSINCNESSLDDNEGRDNLRKRNGNLEKRKTTQENTIQQSITLLSDNQLKALLDLIAWHRLTFLVWINLKQWTAELPDWFVNELQRQAHNHSLNVLKQISVLQKVKQILDDHQIEHLFFKGIILSEYLYNDPVSRHAKDIDLWVAESDVQKVCHILDKAEFVRVKPEALDDTQLQAYLKGQKDMVYVVQGRDSVELELHWRLDKNKLALPFEFSEVLADKQNIMLKNHHYSTFCLEHYLSYLAMHGNLSMWGRLKWLLDWHMVILKAQQEDFDWHAYYKKVSKQGGLVNILIAMHLSKHFFHTPIPEPFNENKKLALGPQMIVNVVIKYSQLMQYPPLYKRWLLRFFLVNKWSYKWQHFQTGLRVYFNNY